MPLQRATEQADICANLPHSLEQQADTILQELQFALSGVVAALPGRMTKAIDLQRALEIDPKLAWRLHKFINANSALSASGMVPGIVPLRRFLAAAERVGVSPKLTAIAMIAFEQFEGFIATQAGDRTAFSAMINRGNDSDGTALLHRKAAFRASAHFLGVQTKAYVMALMVHPSNRHPGKFDMASVTEKIGVQRLRSDARVVLDCFKNSFETIDSVGDTGSPESQAMASILPEFCKNADMKSMKTRPRGNFTELELVAGQDRNVNVGTPSSGDWAFASVERESDEKIGEGEPLQINVCISTPVESFTMDVLLHKSIAADFATRVSNFMCFVVGDMNTDSPQNEYARVAIHETITSLGVGRAVLRHDEAPRNAEVLTHVARRLGWDIESFRVYRLKIAHPVVGSGLKLFFQGQSDIRIGGH